MFMTAPMGNCKSAGERFFRLYYKHCVTPDLDTLFNLLNAIHSLNDKLRKATGESFFEYDEFLALKALRNLFHHEIELINEIRIFSVDELPSIATDLLFMCLIPNKLIPLLCKRVDKKDEAAIRSTFKWYGGIVNINPCIFNFSVHTFEKLQALNLKLEGEEYAKFESTYQSEEEDGRSHFVTGNLTCHAENVEKILSMTLIDRD